MTKPTILPALLAATTLAIVPVAASHAADERQSLDELRLTVINLLNVLVDQGVISREKAAQMVKAAQDKAATDAAALAKADEGAIRVPYVPQIVKDEIAKQVAESVRPTVVADVLNTAKTEQWGVPGALQDWLTRTRLSGDFTTREEGLFFDKSNLPDSVLNYYAINTAGGQQQAGRNAFLQTTGDRIRTRVRAHLGVESALSDSITVGVRLSTGNTSDLFAETQTLDGTSPFALGLDRAFIRLDERNAGKFPWLTVSAGRFANPYLTPTNLIFHQDLAFNGIAATGRLGLGDGSADQSHLFFTAGAHPLQEIQFFSSSDKWLVAGEFGLNQRIGVGQQLRMTGAFYDYFNVTGRLNPATGDTTLYNSTAPAFMRYGNTVFDIANNPSPTVNLFAYASKFRLANVNVTYTVPFGRYQAGVTLDAVRNFGFNTAAVAANVGSYVAPRTKGYQAEFSFGDPTVLSAGAWRAVLGYRYLQRDAVIDAYTDSDFHYFGGTNASGYYLVTDLGVAERVWMRLRYLSANQIDIPSSQAAGTSFGVDTLQLDLNAKF